jgi:PBP1b-binding outer membrane lipoprotein LpoB
VSKIMILVLILLLTGCAGTSQTKEELTQGEETAQPPQVETVATQVDYVCSELISALNAASTSFQEGLADAEYETTERLDF